LINILFLSRILRLRNDLYCVEWGVKLYSLTHLSRILLATADYVATPSNGQTDISVGSVRGIHPMAQWSAMFHRYLRG